MAFTPDFLEELRSRLTLSDVIGRKVALKRKGREFQGLCPFHNEKTPSFTVNDRKGFYHCFGCGAHGDVVGFVMQSEGLSFPDAVERLARDAGLALPAATPAERQRAARAASLHTVVERAASWFEAQLWSPAGGPALAYLRQRGLDDETIRRFRLGFAPDRRDGLKRALMSTEMPEALLVEAGLLIVPEGDRDSYDRFRGRVIFPIGDRRGRLIAFGGRLMGPGEPKYLNSPETPLFHKGDTLYALAAAREAVVTGAELIVAEGYMDVIALHRAGFGGAVAPLGTALTEDQLRLLWKLAPEPILCFDGDKAGARAAARAAERALPLLRPGHSLRFLSLPAGEDPDSLIRQHGATAFATVLATARPLVDLVWEQETAGRALDTPERRAGLEQALARRAAEIADPGVQAQYRQEFRDRLWREFGSRRAARGGPAGRVSAAARAFPARGFGSRGFPAAPPQLHPALEPEQRLAAGSLDASRRERLLLALLLQRPELIPHLAEELAHATIEAPALQRLRTALLDWGNREACGENGIADEAVDALQTSPQADENNALSGVDTERLLAHLRCLEMGQLAADLSTLPPSGRLAAKQPLETALAAWRYVAALHNREVAHRVAIAEAERHWNEDPSEENWQRLRIVIEQANAGHDEEPDGSPALGGAGSPGYG